MAVPSTKECFDLLWHHNVPEEVIRHSLAVSRFAVKLGERLKAEGKKVDLKLLEASCLLHDIGKIESIRNGGNHEKIGHDILVRHGFKEVAEVVLKHSLHYIIDTKNKPRSLEEKILFYSDKRVMGHKVVPLKKRLDDLLKRYPQHKESIIKAEPLVFKLEEELKGKVF